MEPKALFFQITGRGIFTFCALLFTVITLWLSAGYPPRARYVPQVVAIFSLACLLLQLALDSLPRLSELYRKVEKEDVFNHEKAHADQPTDTGAEMRLELVAYFWLLVLLGGLLLFGFLVTIPLYVLFYLRFQAQINWLKSALYGFGTWMFAYLLFVRLFEIRLYPGILIQTFMDI